MDGSAFIGRQVDACVNVVGRTIGIERLEGKSGTPERLGQRCARNNCGEGELLEARDLRRANCPDQRHGHTDSPDAQPGHHAALATTCCSPCSPVVSADSSLCAVFSAPPSAPGTLKTISREASANR